MALELRALAAGEERDFARSVLIPFLETGEDVEEAVPNIEVGRSVVAVDGGRFVANAASLTRTLTVPGPPDGPCPVIPVSAVTAVGVHPTHRRRGLLRSMMGWLADDGRRRGEAVAALLCSESVIYGRFGYGLATSVADVEIETARSAFTEPVARPDLRIVDPTEAATLVPALFEGLRRRRAGEIERPTQVWEFRFTDHRNHRNGGSARYWALGEQGYVSYRAHPRSQDGIERYRVEVLDLYGADPVVEAGLWRYLTELDLVETVTATRPVDDPVRWRLADPRRLRSTAVSDRVWVCLLDTAAALSARGYRADGRLVLAVAPPASPLPADPATDPGRDVGRFVLEVVGGVGTCRRAGPADAVDLHCGLADLGALYLGGVSASTLAAAGRVVAERDGALVDADRILGTTLAPFSGTGF